MLELKLEYPTHTLFFNQNKGEEFTTITNLVNGKVYNDMVDSILGNTYRASNFVENERKLLNKFLLSLIGIIQSLENHSPQSFVFKDEAEYYVFCVINDIKFEEQKWFKTAYIKSDIYTALITFKNASVELLKMVYPEYLVRPKNLYDELIKEEEKKAKLKYDPYFFREFLEQNGIDRLYHFTSSKNVSSINKNGICSLYELKQRGIITDFTSSPTSRNIDERKGLTDYIHLGYEQKHPMLMMALSDGILSHFKVYEINPLLIIEKDTMYSLGNVAANIAQISDDIQFFFKIPFHRFHKKEYLSLSAEDKTLFQSEVLIKNKIDNTQLICQNYY